VIKKAMEVFETTRLDDENRNTYEGRLKWLRDESSALETKYLRGKAEGKAEERIEMAQKMESEGMSKDMIRRITGLESW